MSTATQPPPAKQLRRVRLGLDIGLGVMVLIALLVAFAYWWVRASGAQLDGTIAISGLHAPVTVVRDTRGIPHITASDIHDLYFAQGYVMAQDRLWQMDMLRRLGEGRLAEIFGPQAVAVDHETRSLGLNYAAYTEASHLQPQEATLLDAFAAGVNANIAHRGWSHLPIEFLLLRYRPEPWQPRDTLALAAYMYQVLSNGYQAKIVREAFTKKLGPELAAQLFPDQSPWDVVPGAKPPAPVQGSGFGRGGRRGGRGFNFGPGLTPPGRRRAGPRPAPGADVTENHLPVFSATLPPPSPPRGGSNDWVLAGSRSFTGKPILANDPHLQFQIPGLWWAVQLTAPKLNVAGVAIAGVPGVIIGHNDHIAWGVTNTRADVQDLYRETLDDKGNVRTATGWTPVRHWHEQINVRGAAPVRYDVTVTNHGPIVGRDAGGPLALDWSLYAPGALQSAHIFLAIDEATNFQQFEAALAQFPGPTQNFVYADTAGHVAYQCAGWVPLRRKGDGALPVPGDDPAYNWNGWIPFKQLPRVVDPADGMLATANSRVTPDKDPVTITTNWDAPNRTRRIYQLLGGLNRWNASAMARIQTDVASEQDRDFARDVLTAARNLAAAGVQLNTNTRQALTMLARFNGAMSAASPAPTLAVETRNEFLRRVLAAKVGDVLARGYHWDEAPVFEQWLLANHPAQWLPPNTAHGWDGLLVDALTNVAQRNTLTRAGLHWGQFETLTLAHPVLSHIPLLRDAADPPPVQINGSPLTVKQARNTALGDATTLGPSMRFVANLAAWDSSTLTLVAGESGNVFSPHYRDEFRAYLRGTALPLWFSPRAVAAHRSHALRLTP